MLKQLLHDFLLQEQYTVRKHVFSFHRYMCASSEFERQLQQLRTTNYTHDLAVGGLWSKLKYLDTAR